MSKLSKSVLTEIKKAHLKPTPKWQFVVWRVLFWVLFIASVFLGSLAFGVIIHEVLGMEWSFVGYVGKNRAVGFLLVLPYIWLAMMAVMIFFAHKAFAKTSKGYRHKPLHVIGLVLVLSFVLGGVAHQVRMSQGFEDLVYANVGPYADWQEFRGEMWVNPEGGILVGQISEVDSETVFIMDTTNGDVWAVDIKDGKCKGKCDPEVGMGAFVVGKSTEEFYFEADRFQLVEHDHKPHFFERKKGNRT